MERSTRESKGATVSDRTRVGVVGCGLIAQTMHLPYLAELSDRFEIAALCDVRTDLVRSCAERYGQPRTHARWEDLFTEQLDAVVIATSGDHAPLAIAAAQAGLHVLVEKPMALCSRDAAAMVAAAERAGVCLMVGTMKRYDPAYQRLAQLLPEMRDLRLVRVTTLESPIAPYVSHLPLIESAAGDSDPFAIPDDEQDPMAAALGDADEQTRFGYRWILLDCLVHELNVLQGLLGPPTEISSVSLAQRCVSINMRFGDLDCHLSWVDLPGIARYRQEFGFYSPDMRLTLELPSPFLRNMPSRLLVEEGDVGTPHAWLREEVVSYDEAFRRELIEFSECIRSARQPVTSGSDGLRDLVLMESIGRAHARGVPGYAVPTLTNQTSETAADTRTENFTPGGSR
jgi:predicted dehydrogenase